VAPVGVELCLGLVGAHPAHDQPLGPERGLGDLGLARVGVIVERDPGIGVDPLDRLAHVRLEAHPDRVGDPLAPQPVKQLRVLKPRVGAQQDLALGPGSPDPGDELLGEADDPALGVGRPLAVAHVQDLAGLGARGQQRVVAEHFGVAVGGALLEPAADLAEKRVDVDHQSVRAGAGPGPPGASERLAEHAVELAHVTEGESAQEGAERRGSHHPMAKDLARRARAQQVAVVDRVRPGEDRMHEAHHLAPRAKRAPPAAQIDPPVDQTLEPQALGEGARQDQSGVSDRALIVEGDRRRIEAPRGAHSRRFIVHHLGDLLTRGRGCRYIR